MAFKQQMDICCSSKAWDIACSLLVLKSYPCLCCCGKTTTSKSGGQAPERASCKPPSICSETMVKARMKILGWRKTLEGVCRRSEDTYAQQQSSCLQQMLGSREASPPSHALGGFGHEFMLSISPAQQKCVHIHTKFLLGFHWSLKTCFYFVNLRLTLFYKNQL